MACRHRFWRRILAPQESRINQRFLKKTLNKSTRGCQRPQKHYAILFLLLGILPAVEAETRTPHLGKAVNEQLIRQWNWDIFPNGEGLPQGKGDALAGKTVYQQYCLSCHGDRGEGGSAEELAGAEHGLTDNPPDKTIGTYWPYATTLFDFIRRSMPLNAPGQLNNNQLYAVTAYLLYLNDIIDQTDVMTAKSLPRIKMPNQEGFINCYRQPRQCYLQSIDKQADENIVNSIE